MNSTEHSQVHHSFTIERTYDAPVAAVWEAFADAEAKKGWWGADDTQYVVIDSAHNFEVGGKDVNEGKFHGGVLSRYVATYTDIVENQRIVLSYDMWIDGALISTSVETITMETAGESTNLTLVEQGVHLDGFDTGEQREIGTRGLLDGLGEWLLRQTAS